LLLCIHEIQKCSALQRKEAEWRCVHAHPNGDAYILIPIFLCASQCSALSLSASFILISAWSRSLRTSATALSASFTCSSVASLSARAT
jgi:hypothetical protein